MRKLRLPRQCFRFIQRELKQSLWRFKRPTKFSENGVPGFFDLRDELLAGHGAGSGKCLVGGVHVGFFHWIRFFNFK